MCSLEFGKEHANALVYTVRINQFHSMRILPHNVPILKFDVEYLDCFKLHSRKYKFLYETHKIHWQSHFGESEL